MQLRYAVLFGIKLHIKLSVTQSKYRQHVDTLDTTKSQRIKPNLRTNYKQLTQTKLTQTK